MRGDANIMSVPDALKLRAWYVLQTKPRQEARALEQLQAQGYVCFLPMIQVERIRRAKLHIVAEPLFARYLFVQLDSDNCDWSPIRSTRGVSNMVKFGDRYASIPDDCIESLRNAPQTTQAMFAPGEQIIITSGPFAGLGGVFQMLVAHERALVLIELLSQPQKLTLSLATLKKAA